MQIGQAATKRGRKEPGDFARSREGAKELRLEPTTPDSHPASETKPRLFRLLSFLSARTSSPSRLRGFARGLFGSHRTSREAARARRSYDWNRQDPIHTLHPERSPASFAFFRSSRQGPAPFAASQLRARAFRFTQDFARSREGAKELRLEPTTPDSHPASETKPRLFRLLSFLSARTSSPSRLRGFARGLFGSHRISREAARARRKYGRNRQHPIHTLHPNRSPTSFAFFRSFRQRPSSFAASRLRARSFRSTQDFARSREGAKEAAVEIDGTGTAGSTFRPRRGCPRGNSQDSFAAREDTRPP